MINISSDLQGNVCLHRTVFCDLYLSRGVAGQTGLGEDLQESGGGKRLEERGPQMRQQAAQCTQLPWGQAAGVEMPDSEGQPVRQLRRSARSGERQLGLRGTVRISQDDT